MSPRLQQRSARTSRRRFLAGALAGGLGLAGLLRSPMAATAVLEPANPAMPLLGPDGVDAATAGRRGFILGPGTSLRDDGSPFFYISVVDVDGLGGPEYVLHRIPLDFFGHGIVPDPARPGRAAVFQKKGKGACEVDLPSGRMVRTISTDPARKFYGHGAYSPDGSLLYATETEEGDGYRGLIAVRDARSHQFLGEFPTYGASPHDCRLVDDGRVLVITNGGGPMDGAEPSVTYVDVRTEKLLEKLRFTSPRINAGHLALTAAGDLAVVSAQREGLDARTAPGGVSLRPAGGRFRTLDEPADLLARMYGETLSLCIHGGRGIVAATNPTANLLTFWELATGRLLRHYDVANARGIALTQDEECFVLSYGVPTKLSLIAADTLAPVAGLDLAHTGMSGSHILAWKPPGGTRAA